MTEPHKFNEIDKKIFNLSLVESIKYIQKMLDLNDENFKFLFTFTQVEFFQVMSGKMGLSIYHWLNIGSYCEEYDLNFEEISMYFYEKIYSGEM